MTTTREKEFKRRRREFLKKLNKESNDNSLNEITDVKELSEEEKQKQQQLSEAEKLAKEEKDKKNKEEIRKYKVETGLKWIRFDYDMFMKVANLSREFDYPKYLKLSQETEQKRYNALKELFEFTDDDKIYLTEIPGAMEGSYSVTIDKGGAKRERERVDVVFEEQKTKNQEDYYSKFHWWIIPLIPLAPLFYIVNEGLKKQNELRESVKSVTLLTSIMLAMTDLKSKTAYVVFVMFYAYAYIVARPDSFKSGYITQGGDFDRWLQLAACSFIGAAMYLAIVMIPLGVFTFLWQIFWNYVKGSNKAKN
jgi:hypothetical protein